MAESDIMKVLNHSVSPPARARCALDVFRADARGVAAALMLGASAAQIGTAYLLIVQTEDMVRAQHEIAHEQDAPDELLARLRGGRCLPYFWKTAGNYSPIYEDWEACLHPATEFKGRDWYLYALVKSPGAFNLKYVFPYGDYLERLDRESRQAMAGVT